MPRFLLHGLAIRRQATVQDKNHAANIILGVAPNWICGSFIYVEV